MASKKQVQDPLADFAVPAKDEASSSKAQPGTAPAPTEDLGATPAPAVPVEEPKVIAPPVPPAKGRYKVTEAIRVPFGIQFISLAPGDVISDGLYGAGSVVRLKEAGVKMEEIAEEK